MRAFTYDGAGNILTDNRAGTTTTYTYNNRNRLASATSGALLWGYTYNGHEQLAIRTLTTGGTDVTHFIHDIFGNVIAETKGGGATGATGTQRETIWLPEAEIAPTFQSRAQVDRPLAMIEDVETASPLTWYVHVDHLNRPVRMTDGAKAVVWNAVWTPWGTAHSLTGSAVLNARFPGQWFQLEAGLHYNWHRHYEPTIGRYTQPDPLGFVDGPSLYGYAFSNPAVFVDPTGETPWGTIFGGANLAWQLYNNGGRLDCVKWGRVGLWMLGGGIFNAGRSGAFYFKTTGRSWTWPAVRSWMNRRGIQPIAPGQHRHHWLFEQNQGIGKHLPDYIKNQPWNTNPISREFNTWLASRPALAWTGGPSWAAEVAVGGTIATTGDW